MHDQPKKWGRGVTSTRCPPASYPPEVVLLFEETCKHHAILSNPSCTLRTASSMCRKNLCDAQEHFHPYKIFSIRIHDCAYVYPTWLIRKNVSTESTLSETFLHMHAGNFLHVYYYSYIVNENVFMLIIYRCTNDWESQQFHHY